MYPEFSYRLGWRLICLVWFFFLPLEMLATYG